MLEETNRSRKGYCLGEQSRSPSDFGATRPLVPGSCDTPAKDFTKKVTPIAEKRAIREELTITEARTCKKTVRHAYQKLLVSRISCAELGPGKLLCGSLREVSI